MEFFRKKIICHLFSNLAANWKLSMSRQHELNGRKISCNTLLITFLHVLEPWEPPFLGCLSAAIMVMMNSKPRR